jgi:hypothetical protein
MTSLRDDILNHTAARIAAETDRWCWKAIARGVGWRVWRSEARMEADATGHRIVHDFQLLPPDHPAPGTGMIFGPFSQAS